MSAFPRVTSVQEMIKSSRLNALKKLKVKTMKKKNVMREQSKVESDFFEEKKKQNQTFNYELKRREARVLLSLVSAKKYLLMKDVPAAVSTLREAFDLLSAELDKKVLECHEVFHHSKVLLEMVRLIYSNLDKDLNIGTLILM